MGTINDHIAAAIAIPGSINDKLIGFFAGAVRYGSGSPEGAVSAPVGAMYHRSDGGVGTSAYVKESGSGNTGWRALAKAGSVFKFLQRTSGDITKTSVTNWADFLTDSDLTLPASAGDVLQFDINGLADSTNIALILDVVTRVSGAAVNSFGGGGATSGATGDGVLAWLLDTGATRRLSGAVWYTVQAGDIAAGNVTCRLRCRTGGGTRVVSSTASDPFFLFMENLGPST